MSNMTNKTGIAVTPEEARSAAVVSAEAQVENTNANVSKYRTVKQVVNELLAAGCRRFSGVRVRSAKVTEKETYVMVSLSLEQAVPGYVANAETGIFEKSETVTIFASSYSIGSILKESDETAWAANQLVGNPKGLEVILAGSRVDIIQQEVAGDELYKNPFSNSAAEGEALGHDTIINHVVKIELCNQAKKMLNMMAMSMMGIGF